jgi:hypothetical protein
VLVERRTTADWANRATATHCARGHPLAGANLRQRAGRRVCVACSRGRARLHWHLRYAQAKLAKHRRLCPNLTCPQAAALADMVAHAKAQLVYWKEVAQAA